VGFPKARGAPLPQAQSQIQVSLNPDSVNTDLPHSQDLASFPEGPGLIERCQLPGGARTWDGLGQGEKREKGKDTQRLSCAGFSTRCPHDSMQQGTFLTLFS
jgi:hypothetical protein